MERKSSKHKKVFVGMMAASALLLWLASPNMSHAQTVTIEGRNVHATLTGNASSATATISYTEGPGQVTASLTGHAHYIDEPTLLATPVHNSSSNPTPGGASASVSAPSGCRFITVFSSCKYKLYINDTTYEDTISDRLDFLY